MYYGTPSDLCILTALAICPDLFYGVVALESEGSIDCYSCSSATETQFDNCWWTMFASSNSMSMQSLRKEGCLTEITETDSGRQILRLPGKSPDNPGKPGCVGDASSKKTCWCYSNLCNTDNWVATRNTTKQPTTEPSAVSKLDSSKKANVTCYSCNLDYPMQCKIDIFCPSCRTSMLSNGDFSRDCGNVYQEEETCSKRQTSTGEATSCQCSSNYCNSRTRGAFKEFAIKYLSKGNNKNDGDKPVLDASKNADFLTLFTSTNTAQVAVGFFHYDTSGLHYTIQTSRGLGATNLLFLDEDNNTFFNQKLDAPNETDNKICGVWERVPRLYRRNLAKDTLSVALVTADNPEVPMKGLLTSRRTQSEDTFSALLQSKDTRKHGLAGVALVSLGADGVSVEFSISLKGLSLARKDLKQVATITLEKPDERRVVKEVTSVLSPKALEVSGRLGDITAQDIKWLARGRLTLSLKVSGADFDMTGLVTIRPTCSVWQAVLYDVSRIKSQGGPGAGVALFHPQSDGTFTYELQLIQFPGRPTHMTIETYPRKGRRRVVDDIVSSFGNGWANGSYIKQMPKDLQSLLAEDLVMNIVNEHTAARMQGQIKQVYYEEVHDRIFPSVIMENTGASFNRDTRDSSGTAVAWMRLDENCILNYQVFVDGYSDVYIKKLQPTVVYSIDQQGTPVIRQVPLEQFKKNKSVGKVKKSDVLMGMQNGTVEMTITAAGEAEPRLRGRVTVVDECSGSKHKFNGLIMEDAASLAAPVYTCRYNDKTQPDGSSFRSESKNCTMCSCQRGKITCEEQACPKPNCRNPVKLEGHCCSTCPVPGLLSTLKLVAGNASQGCYLDKKFYRPGETWHPYLPPFGFSKCAICTCQPGNLAVSCNRITCPPLPCPDSEAIRENPNDCCKKCKDAPKVIPSVRQSNESLADEAIIRLPEEELKEGGCRMQSEIFKNGAEWHPRVQPFGIMNCVRCHCKDGKSSCKRQKCPKLSCSFVRKESSECCPVCTDQSDPKARPNRRLLKTKRRQRRRKE